MRAVHAGAALASTGATAMVYGTSRTAAKPAVPSSSLPDPHAAARQLHLTSGSQSTASFRAAIDHGGLTTAQASATRAAGGAAHGSGRTGVRQLLMDVRSGMRGMAADPDSGVGDAAASAAGAAGASAPLLGALCLTANCAAMAGYFVIARSISGLYPPLALTVRSPRHLLLAVWRRGS